MLISLGNDLWVRARHILGFGPITMLPGEWDGISQCAVLVEWAGWVPCAREVRDVMADCRSGGR